MALRPEYSVVNSEFNDFLFAYVGEEESGLQLTMLSALARLGLDPWTEAARLTAMTKAAATTALVATISALPEGHWKAAESQSIAERLVVFLPKPGAAPVQEPQGPRPGAQSPKSHIQKFGPRKWMFWAALAAAVLIMGLFRLYGDRGSEADINKALSMAPAVEGVATAGTVHAEVLHLKVLHLKAAHLKHVHLKSGRDPWRPLA